MSEWSPRPLNKGNYENLIYTTDDSYVVTKAAPAKEELYIKKSLTKDAPCEPAAPKYDPDAIAKIVKSFLEL